MEIRRPELTETLRSVGQLKDGAGLPGSAYRERGHRGPVVDPVGRDPPSQARRAEPPQQRTRADVGADETEAVGKPSEQEIGDAIDIGSIDVDDLPVEHVVGERHEADGPSCGNRDQRSSRLETIGPEVDDRRDRQERRGVPDADEGAVQRGMSVAGAPLNNEVVEPADPFPGRIDDRASDRASDRDELGAHICAATPASAEDPSTPQPLQ